MSGFNPYGNPQYPPPQNQIYPQIYNPANAPAPGHPAPPATFPTPGMNPQFPYQPGFATYSYPGQPQPGNPASMSYPNVTPSAPGIAPGYGFPNATPGFPAVSATPGYPTVSPTPVAAVEWIPSSSQSAPSLTDRAVVAGYEGHDGSPLWIIRARFEGDLIPGKLAVKHHAAYVPWGGNENAVHNFEVCCAHPSMVRWIESRDGVIPPKAVPAGHTSSGEPLYVGRAKQQGSLTPGKVHPSHRTLYISFAGQEHPHKTYEVLCTV